MRKIGWVAIATIACGQTRGERTRTNDPIEASLSIARAAAPRMQSAIDLGRHQVAGIAKVSLASRSRAATRLALSDEIAIEIRADVPADVASVERDHTLVYAGVDRATDMIVFADAAGVEELRVVHEIKPVRLAWDVHLSRGLERLRERNGFVEALDARGVARLRCAPIVAWDAKGSARTASVRIEGQGKDQRLIAELDTKDLIAPLVIDPAWGATSSMAVIHDKGASTLLADGRFMIAGGQATSAASVAEIYDGSTNAWTMAAAMPKGRYASALTKLSSGKILISGGYEPATSVISATAVYDPALDAWTAKASMPQVREFHTATALSNGKVLVAGGDQGGSGSTSNLGFLYDPTGDTWSNVPGTMDTLHSEHMAFAVSGGASGRVLIVGGNATATNGVDQYDTATNAWITTADMATPRREFFGVVLKDGNVLVGGGSNFGGDVSGVELWSPATGWKTVGSLAVTRAAGPLAGVLPSGKVVVAGGYGAGITLSTSEIYDPVSQSFVAGPALKVQRASASAAPLPDGRILATGGFVTGCCGPSWHVSAETYGDSLAKGTSCGAGGACASGFCIDGVCCDRACTGQCESCNEVGSIGTCKAISGTPHAGRTPCTGSGTCAGTCDGTSGTCTYAATSTTCVTPTCSGGIGQPAAFCDGAGACGATPATVPCSPYACGTTSCKTTCSVDGDCVASAFCNAGACTTKKAAGAACTGASGCASGFCESGVCCNKACSGACESCNASGSLGTCLTKPMGTVCGVTGCTAGSLTKAATCDGTATTCPAPSPTPCPNGLICADATTCKTACTTGADCTTGYCDLATAKCTAPPGDAGADTSITDTGTPPEDTGSATDALIIAEEPAPKLPEKPVVPEFQRCVHNSECSTGHCVDGVCCDTACTDRCHSCALLGSPGKCTQEPVGVDLRNECGPANTCLGTCGAKGECIGAGTGTMCARNRCTTASTGAGPAYCASPGATCNVDDTVPFDCSPYICEPAFGACRSSCASSSDCANGFICDVGSKTCTPLPPPADEGGCAASSRPVKTSLAAWVVLAIAIGVFRRRRMH